MRTTKQSTTRTWLTSLALLASLFVNSPASTVGNSRLAPRDPARQDARPFDSALSRYAVDLTELARAGRLETAQEHKAELNQIERILSEDPQHNPVLINESANDQFEIAAGLAREIISGPAPESLLNKQVFSLNLDALSAGAKTSKQFVARWQAILTEAAATEGQIILFVDQLHQFAGTYANQVVSAALRDALKQGQLRVVGAATSEAYAAYISADESLASLFQTIRIDDEIAKGSESGKRGLSENEDSYCADKAFVGAPVCASRGDELHRRSNEDPPAFEELTIDLTANQSPKDFLTIEEREGYKIRGMCDTIYLHPEVN